MKSILITYFLICTTILSQSILFKKSFGNFSDAESFDIDLNKNFYVTELEENNVIKLDSAGNLIQSIGGFGWDESTFDDPVCIITNTLSVYVADKNNHRVQRFDKDLNFLSQLNGEGENSSINFGYPTSITINSIGDLFLLDSDNNRILKFDLTGNYLGEIGSNDAGKFALDNPVSLTSDLDGNIYVLDSKIIKVFDQYGNPKYKLNLQRTPKKIKINSNYLIYIFSDAVEVFDLNYRKTIFNISDKLANISDALISGSEFFVLTEKQIKCYSIINH